MQRSLTPVEVPGLDQVVDLVVGSANTAFVIRDDGTIWSWGGNGSGQLGDGSQKDRWQPTLVSPLPTM
jgi:alpha-tubulin suppressor-like RCC1 family protein